MFREMIDRLPFEFLWHVINEIGSIWFVPPFYKHNELVCIAAGWLLNTKHQLAILDYEKHYDGSPPQTDSSKKEMSKQIRMIPQSTSVPSLKAYPLHQAVLFLIPCAVFMRANGK